MNDPKPVSLIVDNVVASWGNRRKGVPTGMIALDEHLNGLEKDDFIIVAGRPGMGKSAYAGCVALAASQAHKVAFFSLEMSEFRVIDRLISGMAKVTCKDMVEDKLNEKDKAMAMWAAQELKKRNLVIDESTMLSTKNLRDKLEHIKPELVIVDYLQLMRGNQNVSREREIGIISRELKLLAKDFNVPIMVLCQLNRDCEKRDDPMPRMSDLRESGSLEQDADKVLLLHRPAYYEMQASHSSTDDDGEAKIIIGKNRHGPVEIVDCIFMPEYVSFYDKEIF